MDGSGHRAPEGSRSKWNVGFSRFGHIRSIDNEYPEQSPRARPAVSDHSRRSKTEFRARSWWQTITDIIGLQIMSRAVDDFLASIQDDLAAGKQRQEALEAKSLFRLLNYCPPHPIGIDETCPCPASRRSLTC